MIDLCVINYNTRPLLNRFLDSLHSDINECPKSWNLHIADNGSTDDTVQWINNNYRQYEINSIFENENIGYSAAANQLAKHSSGDIIAILNADVWMKSSDVYKIQEIFYDNPDVHILGPKQRDETGRITHAGVIGSPSKPEMRGWLEYDPLDSLYRDRVNCITVSGAAFFIRREVWNAMTFNVEYRKLYPNATGAFLPTPHYYEETWCAYFARHLGYNVVYDGSVSIGHSWHASSPKPNEGYSHADAMFPVSREIFRKACDFMGIERD